MEKTLILRGKGVLTEELEGKTIPKSTVARFRLEYLNNNENQAIHKVEVRNINFMDLMRHLKKGESVLITPELLKDSLTQIKNQNQTPWYFAHM
jgi:DNA-directed RNA polymerase beta' subunit